MRIARIRGGRYPETDAQSPQGSVDVMRKLGGKWPDRDLPRVKQDESSHPDCRATNALDGAVVLLDDIVQVFVLPDLDRRWPLSVERFKGRQISAALVHRDRFGNRRW